MCCVDFTNTSCCGVRRESGSFIEVMACHLHNIGVEGQAQAVQASGLAQQIGGSAIAHKLGVLLVELFDQLAGSLCIT